MIREHLCDKRYWDKWVAYGERHISEVTEEIKKPSANPSYRPQYVYKLAQEHWHQILSRYSRGDTLCELLQYFPPLLDAWESAELLGKDVWTSEQQLSRHDWSVKLHRLLLANRLSLVVGNSR